MMITTLESNAGERTDQNSEREKGEPTVPPVMSHRATHSEHSFGTRRLGFTNRIFFFLGILLALSSWRSVEGIEMDICKEKSCYPATGNLLIGRERRLSTTSTCGIRRIERYCIVSHLEDKKKCFFCNSTQPWMQNVNERSHQISNIVSERISERKGKWWQSENGVANVSIRLDLEAEFHFTHLIMTFKTFRPAAMFIERSSDFGKTWKIYRYFAYECGTSFPGIPEGPPRNHTDVICTSRYSNVAPSSGGEVVFKVLSPHIPLEDPYADEIQELLRITNLRVNFTKLHTLGDDLLDYRPEIDEKYYYAIYDMVVRGSCSCYGHASKCVPKRDDSIAFVNYHRPDMVHGTCECTHHTGGLNCEKCEDFYNDLPWRPAIDKEVNACKRCNCNNHANRCHFDKRTYEESGYVSGGVCDDCQHNTHGKNCEQCKPMFYRDMARDITDPYVCKPCQCDLQGSLLKGVCQSHTDEERNLVSGRCSCKDNVAGERCDRCKHGFWDLQEDDEKGCKPCTCFLTGTVGNEGCDKRTGTCTCKRLVTGENCDQCLENHYGLSEDPEGCKPCECDIGGSYEQKCDITTGQCRCRPHFSGRKCDQPESGYFCANVDYYKYEAEDAQLDGGANIELKELVPGEAPTWTGTGFVSARLGSMITFKVNELAVSRLYNLVIRFRLDQLDRWDKLDVAVIRPGPADRQGPCANANARDDMTTISLSRGGRYYEVQPAVCLEKGVSYEIRLTFGEARQGVPDMNLNMLIDSIVLSPPTDSLEIFQGSALAEYHKNDYERYQCRHYTLSLQPQDRLHPVCAKYICPVAANTVQTGLSCNCSDTGSTSGICDTKGGQCECKANVIGRTCDKCAPGTYGFGPKGCAECECNSVGALDNFCDTDTGQCKCRDDGITGRKCDQCYAGFWDFANSCRPCQCNGHADACDQITGACIDCRDLTDGHECERCKDGYYGNPLIGSGESCRPCPCPGGPGSGSQHADTCYLDQNDNVVCNCKLGYSGEKCDSCIANYWGNPTELGETCEKCDCNGNIDFRVPESCDAKTGKCLKCLHNTEGAQCENCIDGYFGDATIRQCTKCVCNILGTNSSAGACDRVSGQCPCLPNVVGMKCDACAPNHWQLAMGNGCAACECDPTGVLDGPDGHKLLQCNEFDGKCQCKYERGGRTCSECQDYHWGDPTSAESCKRCECNPTGSTSLQCNRDDGTCLCQPGSGGPKCDQCARGYTGRWPNCEPCGECFKNWDEILQKLNNEAQMLVERANNIEDTGVASVYDDEFKEMEGKLAEVKAKLDTANVSQSDVDELKEKMDMLSQQIEDATKRLDEVDRQVLKVTAGVDTEEQSLSKLEQDAKEVMALAKELEMNETQLRQADSEGAFNITREAARRSEAAARAAEQTDRVIGLSESERNKVKSLIDRSKGDFEKQFAENQGALEELGEKISELEKEMPAINEQVCGAPGDPCDATCGGAMCGSCGGANCGKGAVPQSEGALEYAQQAADKLEQKQKEATELLKRVRTALDKTVEAKNNAIRAYETAQRTAETANVTKAGLQELKDKIDEFLAKKSASPAQIRELATEVLNMSISLSPEQIQELGEQIRVRLNSLENIDSILAETRGNLTRARNLKREADLAKERAETILNTTNGVLDALNKAKEAQAKARIAIDEANENIEATNGDLDAIKMATGEAEKAAKESNDSIGAVKKQVLDVQTKYVEIARDLEKANDQASQAKAKADAAEETRKRLQEDFREAQDKMGAKDGDSTVPRKRAEKLKNKAATLLESTRRYVDDIEKNKAKFGANELSLNKYALELEGLLERIDTAATYIAEKKIFHETCDVV